MFPRLLPLVAAAALLSACGGNERVAGYPDTRPASAPNPPGTAVTRTYDRVVGTDISGAYPQQRDGTPGNPPGTVVTRSTDRAVGSDISGAYPQNERSGRTGR